jgi:replicative DNA helicase
MNDAKLIASAIASREAYETVAPHLAETEFSPPAQFWWKLIGEYYARDRNTNRVDLDALHTLGSTRVANNPKTRELVNGFIRDLPNGVSPANVAQVALEQKRHSIGMELAAAIAAGDQKKQAKLLPVYHELAQATSLTSRRQVKYERATSVDDLFSKVGAGNRIPLAPSRLNSRINGGALPGHHILVFGRPEVGKSAFAINFAAGMAVAQNQRTLVVENEDQIDITKARGVSRVTGLTAEEIEADVAKAIALYKDRGGEERLQFVQMYHGGPDDLIPVIEEFEPAAIVLNQIRNLAGAADGMVQRLEENGQRFRELLIKYRLVGLSVTQAGGSAHNKAWLDEMDLDSSKTGLTGTTDLQLGLGADAAMLSKGQRALSIIKNKLSSAPNSKEGLLLEIDPSRSKLT